MWGRGNPVPVLHGVRALNDCSVFKEDGGGTPCRTDYTFDFLLLLYEPMANRLGIPTIGLRTSLPRSIVSDFLRP